MDTVAVITMGTLAVAAILAAAYAVKRALDAADTTCRTVAAMKLSNGDPMTFRRIQLQLADEEEPEVMPAPEEAKPAEPIQVGTDTSDEVVDFVAHGASVDELLGSGWRTT